MLFDVLSIKSQEKYTPFYLENQGLTGFGCLHPQAKAWGLVSKIDKIEKFLFTFEPDGVILPNEKFVTTFKQITIV